MPEWGGQKELNTSTSYAQWTVFCTLCDKWLIEINYGYQVGFGSPFNLFGHTTGIFTHLLYFAAIRTHRPPDPISANRYSARESDPLERHCCASRLTNHMGFHFYVLCHSWSWGKQVTLEYKLWLPLWFPERPHKYHLEKRGIVFDHK